MEPKADHCAGCRYRRQASSQATELSELRDKLGRIAALAESRIWGETPDGARLDRMIIGIVRGR